MDKQDKVIVEVVRCYVHKFDAVLINSMRVTGGKCCGSWTTVKKFRVRKDYIMEALNEGVGG